MQVKVIYDEPRQQVWILRLIREGEKYGLNDSLFHKGDDPLVEFYGPEHAHTDLGQFVTRYYASTLMEGQTGKGLLLDTGSPKWRLSEQARLQVVEWLARQCAKPTSPA